jgi:hypothetical protein
MSKSHGPTLPDAEASLADAPPQPPQDGAHGHRHHPSTLLGMP